MTTDEIEAWRRVSMPASARKFTAAQGDACAYVYEDSLGRPCARTFFGKSRKPYTRHWFRTAADREKHVRGIFASAASHAKSKAERTATRKAKGRGLELGDVLKTCWGYDQTNVEWYQVTALIGDTMVEVRELAAGVEETQWLQGKTVPLLGQFTGEPLRRKAVDGRVKICDVITAWREEPLATIGGKAVYAAAHYTAYA